MKKIALGLLCVVISSFFCFSSVSSANEIFSIETAEPSTWVATDGLDRSVATISEAGAKKDKFVGLFYWNWHEPGWRNGEIAVNNNDIITAFNNETMWTDTTHPAWSWELMNHSWHEPVYGYYLSDDTWVLRRHAEALADAGVDVIFLDCTNATHLFDKSLDALFKTFQQAYDDGVKVPKISFVLSFGSSDYRREQLEMLYSRYYRDGLYKDTWFIYEGKPMVMGTTTFTKNYEYYNEIKDFFTMRSIDPRYINNTGINDWTWSNLYPQHMAYIRKDKKTIKEQMSVSVAMNCDHNGNLSSSNAGSSVVNGRTYTVQNGYDTRINAVEYGAHFSEQFEYAIAQDPEFIFITGWNERIAMRFAEWQGTLNGFADQFSAEFSRDIEFSKTNLKDSYYYQMVDYIRKFKGCAETPVASEPKVIDINSTEDMWASVSPEYIAYKGNTFNRDNNGYGDLHYYNATGRNDITSAKVARDSENIYFMVETKENLSPRSDEAWMRLLIDVNNGDKNWETFDYIVNRRSPTDMATLERSTGGWNWETIGQVYYNINENRLQIKIPKAMLGITGDEYTINFKWSDNMQNDGDIMDFYINGDVAPSGRFKYQFMSN
ncbi:MAG: hypothetical protein DBX47_03565 [Clostridiales bacterium]|nr:MAG: hypothetical protein DBX47_03565 [Clostridiales bacterium]